MPERRAALTAKHYDRRYFDRWYRDPRRRVRTPAQLRRRVALALAVTEYLLERPVRSVLDVGCGEGAWQPVLRALRPGARYTGIDPSPYAVARYGTRRNLRLGGLETLDEVLAPREFDLLVCNDVLHYLDDEAVEAGLALLRLYAGAVLHLPVFTSADAVSGDCRGFHRRPPAFYHAALARAGFVPCGLHCWLASPWAGALAAMERLAAPAARPRRGA